MCDKDINNSTLIILRCSDSRVVQTTIVNYGISSNCIYILGESVVCEDYQITNYIQFILGILKRVKAYS